MNPVRFYFPLVTTALFTVFCGWIAVQAMNAAEASINTHQEQQAEALCKVDPSYCGLRR